VVETISALYPPAGLIEFSTPFGFPEIGPTGRFVQAPGIDEGSQDWGL